MTREVLPRSTIRALHLEPAFAYFDYSAGEFPKAKAACRQALSLPIYPELLLDQQRAVVAAISRFYSCEP